MKITVHPYREGDSWPNTDPICPRVTVRRMDELDGCRVAGQFRLTDVRKVGGAFPRVEATLADFGGSATALFPHESSHHIDLPESETLVTAIGRVQLSGGRRHLRLMLLREMSGADANSAADLLCVPEKVHGMLRDLEDELPEPLRLFLGRVLLDPSIGPGFKTCRASAAHHHSNVGGLLEHSFDNLDMIGTIVQRTLPRDTLSVGIAKVAYVVHDIGKLWTVGTKKRPWMHKAMAHEHANLLMLAPHLAWLSEVFPEAWLGLTSILSYLAIPAPQRKRPKYFPAEVVAQFDGWSAAKYSQGGLEKLLGGEVDSDDQAQVSARRWKLVGRP